MIELTAESPADLGKAIEQVFQNVIEDFVTIDYGPYLVGEHKHYEELHSGYFANNSGPDGNPWPELKESTRRRKGHGRILRDRNWLWHSLTRPTEHAVRDVITDGPQPGSVFGTSLPYSAPHDKATDNRAARRHVGMNNEHLEKMVDRVADFVIEDLKHASRA